MTMAHLYHPVTQADYFGSPLADSAGIRNMNALAEMGERAVFRGPRPRLYYGRVILDPTRVGHDAGLVSEEVIYPLTRLMGSTVTVALDIGAEAPGGIPETLVRMLTESGQKLKFVTQGFVRD